MKKTVTIITTGGTIVSEEKNNEGANPRLSGEDLIQSIPNVDSLAKLVVDNFIKIPSIAITLSDMLNLAEKVKSVAGDPDVDGIVITHGTDTLEETAYILDLLVESDKPIVLTGAMRAASSISSDGPANLEQAILVAASETAQGYPPLVVLNNDIHLARYVTKAHASKLEAFTSVNTGPIGVVREQIVSFFYQAETTAQMLKQKLRKQNHIKPASHQPLHVIDFTKKVADASPKATFPKVEIIKCYADASNLFLKTAVEENVDAIVIEGMGAGHVPPSWIDPIEKAIEKGILVVAVPRTAAGLPLYNTYGMVGGEIHLQNLGVLYSHTTSEKTRLFLTLAIMNKWTPEEIQFFLYEGDR